MAARRRTGARSMPGLGIDAYGGAVIDPTENVKDLMEASITSLSREAALQEKLVDEKIKRMEREWIHQAHVAELRAAHAKETRAHDTDRWEKTRTIDMANAREAAAQVLAALNNNSATQERTAQTLRDQVASTAQATQQAQAALFNPLADRVSSLEKSSYTGAGRQAVSDPQMDRLTLLVEQLATNQSRVQGTKEGMGDGAKIGLALIGLVATGVSILGGLLGIAGVLYAVLKP